MIYCYYPMYSEQDQSSEMRQKNIENITMSAILHISVVKARAIGQIRKWGVFHCSTAEFSHETGVMREKILNQKKIIE